MPPIMPTLLCPTLVGRDEALGALVTALDAATAGHGRSALIVGEAGIGKTALLRRFIDVARERGARTAIGECIEIEAKRPLGPFVDIVDELARAGILRPGVARPDLESGHVDEETRYRVYLSFANLFTSLGRAAPLVVVVEDLHWADEATLELFGYLARKLRDGRVLLVGSYRSDELHRQHPLRPLLAELARARLADEIRVERLSPVELSRFLRETMRLDRDPSPAFRDAMQERCEGNPLFVEEVLKALQQEGALELRDGQWRRATEVERLALPDSIRDAVQARLVPLTPRARRALQIAAVMGQTFEFDLLREVSGIGDEDLARDLRSALDAQIIIAPPAGIGGAFTFRHALTRESVLAELLEPERRELHRAIGLAIEHAGGEPASGAEELAYHFDEARDPERAFRYRILAAEASRRSAAFARSARHLERAIALAPSGQSIAALYLRLAEAAHLADELPRAMRAADEGARAYKADGESLRAGAALRYLARLRWQLADPTAIEAALEAVQVLEPLGRTAELAAAYAEVGRAHFFLHDDLAVAQDWAERAIAVARASGGAVDADLLVTLGLVISLADPVRAAGLTREGIDLAKRTDKVVVAARGYVNLFSAALWDPRTGLNPGEVFGELVEFVERSGHHPSALQYIRGLHALSEGDFDAVLELVAETPAETNYARLLLHISLIVRIARDGPAGIEPALPPPFPTTLGAPAVRHDVSGRAKIRLLGGDLHAAQAEVEAIRGGLEAERPRGHFSTELVVVAVHAAYALGDADAIAWWSARAKAWAPSGPLGSIAGRYAAAEASAASGDPRAAAELFGAAADALHALWSPVLETVTRLRRAEMLLQSDAAAAGAEVERVVAFWRKGEATWYLGQLARWAAERAIPLPSEPHAAQPKQTLTEREREVARLVAEGLSNKEIAERLVVSERTAEGHVQRILDKLNFRSRTQIAVWEAEARTGAGRP